MFVFLQKPVGDKKNYIWEKKFIFCKFAVSQLHVFIVCHDLETKEVSPNLPVCLEVQN